MERLGKLFADLPDDLARQALTHSSWVDRRSESYERLAFLGDSVLGLAVTTHLWPRLEADAFGAGRLTKIRAHLADELDVDPDRISEATRFKEDLDADSLDLYTLVQELEDSYGVKMSDEEAAGIRTVGQAVDFVLAKAPDRHSS